MPSAQPITTASAAVSSPTSSEIRVPYSTRLQMSRPTLSLPIQKVCCNGEPSGSVTLPAVPAATLMKLASIAEGSKVPRNGAIAPTRASASKTMAPPRTAPKTPSCSACASAIVRARSAPLCLNACHRALRRSASIALVGIDDSRLERLASRLRVGRQAAPLVQLSRRRSTSLRSEQLHKRQADESLFEPIASPFWLSSLFGEALHGIDLMHALNASPPPASDPAARGRPSARRWRPRARRCPDQARPRAA